MDGDSKYVAGGELAPNGKVYLAPLHAPQVLCIDPETHTTEMLGPELEGEYKYRAGSVLATNGIYFAPFHIPQVLCIDPEARTTEMLGPELDGDYSYFICVCLRRNGHAPPLMASLRGATLS